MSREQRLSPLPDDQPTLGKSVTKARMLALGFWTFGFVALIAEELTGTTWWHIITFAMYMAMLPLALIVSTALRTRQRNLDKQWAQRLHSMAVRDDLTGLFNRRAFNVALEPLISECRLEGLPLSVAFVDLNDFKTVNDTYGHAAGDVALQSVARCLLEVIGDRGIVARTGGDEFGVILPGMSEAAANALFGAACKTLAIPVPGNATLSISGTVGIATLEDSVDVGCLLRCADDRLYEGKRTLYQQSRVA